MYFFWSRQKNYAVQLLKCPFKRISLKGQFGWKHAPEDHHVVKKAAGRVAKLFTAEKEKLHWQHIFLWHPQFSTMVIHQWWGICGIKFEYVLLKTYQVTGSRLLPTCLANSTGRPGSPCLFFKISETVSNFNARLSLWLLERCYCLMKPSTSPCSSSSLIPSSLHLKKYLFILFGFC